MDDSASDSTETRHLLDQCKAGDAVAFEQLFARHRAELHEAVALRLDPRLRGRFDPSDVIQEAQLEAFRRLEDYLERRPMPFRLWLRKTAQQRLQLLKRDHLKTARRAVDRQVGLPHRSSVLFAERVMASGETPSEQLSRRELAAKVQHGLARLTDADREILLMRVLEELSYEEIGCLLDISAAAARKRHGRALLRLHRILSDQGFEDRSP
jgi:RNA polymerase sigma-70 factor (ECF subfamily)